MRVASVILMSILVLSISTQDSFMLMIFKLNQTHIATHLCVNRDNPEMECNGTCFLKKKMKEAHDHKDKEPIPFTTTEKTNLLFLATGWEQPIPSRPLTNYLFPKRNEFHNGLIWASRLFRPPII